MATTVSPQGAAFTAGGEGFVSHYYKDSGGVGTIGEGFTTASKVFNDYWLQTRGHKLRAGDTITREESTTLLQKVMNEEYAPPVAKKFGDSLPQNQFDATTDTVYNCGAGTLGDVWAGLLAKKDVVGAAARLLNTRVTAGGKVVAGLYHRRAAEAALLRDGDYGAAVAHATAAAADPSVAEDLAKLGFKDVTSFQAANPPLEVDGVAGPATRAAIARALTAKTASTVAKTTAPASTAAGAGTHVAVTAKTIAAPAAAISLHTLYWAAAAGVGVLAVVGIAYLIYSNRGVILGKRTPA